MIVDAHLDLAYNALCHGRPWLGPPRPGSLVTRDTLAAAGVGLVFATIFCPPAVSDFGSEPDPLALEYATAREAHLLARSQVEYYRSIGLALLGSRSELDDHLARRADGDLAAVLLMEGADPILEPAAVAFWWQQGVRIVGLAWSGTRYSGGSGGSPGTARPGPVTEAGFRLLEAMGRLGMVLDLSHMTDDAVSGALGAWRGPVIASHSNHRDLTPGPRQVPAEVVAEIGARGGMVGISLYSGHLRVDGVRAGLDDVVEHVRAHARSAGGPEHVGLGTDLDGGFGADRAAVAGLDEYRELEARLRRHFAPAQVEGILGGNWIDFLRRSLP